MVLPYPDGSDAEGGAHLVFVIGDDTAYRSNAHRHIAPSFTKDQQSRFDNSGAGVLPSDRGLSNDNRWADIAPFSRLSL
ncbi:MAG: hypothetical protein R1F54_06200 [Candidatus Zeuxoniibacter abyssi]|nr:MAG: hypothetical protein R1F54_06200 [Candidatus Persebacteraceae bacterium AB1(2)]